MTYKIGIFCSAEGASVEKIKPKAHQLGEILSTKKVIIITGACDGLPYETAFAAYKKGAKIWGYSQAPDFKTQEKLVPHDASFYDKLFYIPKDYFFVADKLVTRKYRNVSSTANCDAGIIIAGRWGTLNEFTDLYDMGKIIGVLTGTGGIADELENLNKKIYKPGKAMIVFNNDPEKLVKQVIAELEKTQ